MSMDKRQQLEELYQRREMEAEHRRRIDKLDKSIAEMEREVGIEPVKKPWWVTMWKGK